MGRRHGARPVRRRRPALRRRLQPGALLLLRAALPRLRRRRRALGVGPGPARAPRAVGGGLRDRAGRGAGGLDAAAGHRRHHGRRPASDHRRRRRTVALAPPRDARHRRAVSGVPRAPLGLPAQGGRPALVGDRAPVRPAQGRAGRDPVRRVRRRETRRACTPRYLLRRWPPPGWTTPTALTSTGCPA